MTTAKKAAKAESIDEAAMVDKIARDIEPEPPTVRQDGVKAGPANSSEGPNGAPSTGPDEEVGMTAVVDSTAPPDAASAETVHMVNAAGDTMDVGVADVKIHERSGWKRAEEEEA